MSQYFSLLLVLILCVASSKSISAKVVDVDVICKEATNTSFCSNLLNSIPGGAKGVELVDLAQYTIGVLNENFINTSNLINKLQIVNNLPIYSQCALAIVSATTKLLIAQLELTLGLYSGLIKDATDVLQSLLGCSVGLIKSEASPILAKYIGDLQQADQVLQIILKYLNLG